MGVKAEPKQTYASGTTRSDRTGKGRYDLLPPYGIHRLAQHFENGSAVHGDRNWEQGQDMSRFIDSALRHIFQRMAGKADEDHLAAAAWNILCAIDQEERIAARLLPPELDDIPRVEDWAECHQAAMTAIAKAKATQGGGGVMRKTRVYVAGPYTIGNVAANVRRAILAAEALQLAGYAAFCPHLNHLIDFVCPDISWEEWLSRDKDWLAVCDVMLRLDGESRGAEAERAFAGERGIPVYESPFALFRETKATQED